MKSLTYHITKREIRVQNSDQTITVIPKHFQVIVISNHSSESSLQVLFHNQFLNIPPQFLMPQDEFVKTHPNTAIKSVLQDEHSSQKSSDQMSTFVIENVACLGALIDVKKNSPIHNTTIILHKQNNQWNQMWMWKELPPQSHVESILQISSTPTSESSSDSLVFGGSSTVISENYFDAKHSNNHHYSNMMEISHTGEIYSLILQKQTQFYNGDPRHRILAASPSSGRIFLADPKKIDPDTITKWKYCMNTKQILSIDGKYVLTAHPSQYEKLVLQPVSPLYSQNDDFSLEVPLEQQFLLRDASIPDYRLCDERVVKNQPKQLHLEKLEFFICSKLNNLVLDAKGGSENFDTPIITWRLNGKSNQRFRWSGDYLIIKHASLCLNIDRSTCLLKVMGRQDSEPQEFFLDYDQENDGYLIRLKNNGQCLTIQNGQYGKGSRVTCKRYHRGDLSQLWTFDFIPSYEVDESIKIKSGWGNRCRVLKLPQSTYFSFNREYDYRDTYEFKRNMVPERIFWKPLTKSDLKKWWNAEYYSTREASAANLAHYITDGLVPKCQKSYFQGYQGVYQDFIEMDDSLFLCCSKSPPPDYSTVFSDTQLHQLFTHMIADRLISNFDFHQKNYGVDKHENIISFDKEQAFGRMKQIHPPWSTDANRVEPVVSLALSEANIWSEEGHMNSRGLFYINAELARQILGGKVRIDPNHPIIENMFKRCESLSFEKFFSFLGPYAKQRFKRDERQCFLRLVYHRIRYIRGAVYTYFSWTPNSSELDLSTMSMGVWQSK